MIGRAVESVIERRRRVLSYAVASTNARRCQITRLLRVPRWCRARRVHAGAARDGTSLRRPADAWRGVCERILGVWQLHLRDAMDAEVVIIWDLLMIEW